MILRMVTSWSVNSCVSLRRYRLDLPESVRHRTKRPKSAVHQAGERLRGEELSVVVDDGVVTLAGRQFETPAIHDRDVATGIVDQFPSLQRASCDADRTPLHSEQLGKLQVCDTEMVRVRAVMRQQQQAGQARLNFVEMGASGGLRELSEQHIQVAADGS